MTDNSYKTVHENEVMINPPKEEFFIFNAGSINGRPFTEGEKKELEETKKAFYEKYSAQNFEEDYWIEQINNLQRYSEVYERDTGILPNEDGEYIKLEDVLLLFSAQKELNKS